MNATETKALRDRVYALMAELPEGKVTTYGDLAAMAGCPYAARQVGTIAHGGPTELPWYRLVNARGGLAVGFPGGRQVQQQLLEQDGIMCDASGRVVEFAARRWCPGAPGRLTAANMVDSSGPISSLPDTELEERLPLIVIAGPTASGKTALAIRLAEKFSGEIICADSRTVYTGMDIGTAKPTAEERRRVPHWGVDLVDPGQPFSAAQFQSYARQTIAAIRARGHLPFLVGGTGLYIDAVLFDFQFGRAADQRQRQIWAQYSLDQLHKYCENNNIELPSDRHNKRYVIRAIEQCGRNNKRRLTPVKNCFVVAIATDKATLRTRIVSRAEQIFSHNVVEEAIKLGVQYGWHSEAMTGNIYPLIKQYLDKKIDQTKLQQKFITSDWRLAKRQLTWLRRNPHVLWGNIADVERYLTDILVAKRR